MFGLAFSSYLSLFCCFLIRDGITDGLFFRILLHSCLFTNIFVYHLSNSRVDYNFCSARISCGVSAFLRLCCCFQKKILSFFSLLFLFLYIETVIRIFSVVFIVFHFCQNLVRKENKASGCFTFVVLFMA